MVVRLHQTARLALVLALVGSTQGYLFLQGAFHLHKDAIVERFCVNVDRPELECEASCYLAERLKEQERRERQSALLEVMLTGTLWAPGAVALAMPDPAASSAFGPAAEDALPRAPVYEVFHPPRTVA